MIKLKYVYCFISATINAFSFIIALKLFENIFSSFFNIFPNLAEYTFLVMLGLIIMIEYVVAYISMYIFKKMKDSASIFVYWLTISIIFCIIISNMYMVKHTVDESALELFINFVLLHVVLFVINLVLLKKFFVDINLKFFINSIKIGKKLADYINRKS